MATRILNVALRIALLTAVVASVVLFVEYGSTGEAGFCGAGGGCAKVRGSAFSHIGPVKLPAIGIGAFSGLLALAVWASRKRHYKVLAIQTGLAALGAITLIALMVFKIGAVCKWCMVVDVSAILSFGLALAIYRREPVDVESVGMRSMWAVAAVTAIAVPFLWNYSVSATVVSLPKPIAKYQVEGKVNVIMFTDFQCPHCRRLHEVIEELRPTLGDRLHIVRMMMPMHFHPGAKPAALAYMCMPEDKLEAAAERFYTARVAELTPSGVIEIAGQIGLNPNQFALCMADPETQTRLAHHQTIFRNADLGGVPASYVNAELVKGADPIAMKSALNRAQGGDGGGSDVIWMFLFIGLVVGGVSYASISKAADETSDEQPEELDEDEE
jgi:uncharacterized membrane protein/predicted DsbA family dithiol-disulfide isomerase